MSEERRFNLQLWLLVALPSALSVLVGLAVIASYIRFPGLRRKHSYMMLLQLALADTLHAALYLQPPPQDGSLACAVQ
jgi:hypothetical protein